MFKGRKKNSGQTALEYALVIGVICVGVIMAAKFIFGGEQGEAAKLMRQAVQNASDTLKSDGHVN